jgi:diguanylate cyclase (GGDEF)-like protein
MYLKMQEMAITDGLTGLLNHRAFQELMNEELKRMGRSPMPLSLLMADIDFFKKINDTYGYRTGDLVLKRSRR